jgi:hypothetical protein
MHATFLLILLVLISLKIFCNNENKESKMAKLCAPDWRNPFSMTTGSSATGHDCTELMKLSLPQKLWRTKQNDRSEVLTAVTIRCDVV